MSVILFAATPKEIAPFQQWLCLSEHERKFSTVECMITGTGILASCYSITSTLLQKKPSLVIQAGIAGSINQELPLGQVVLVKDEMIGDQGVKEASRFVDSFDLDLMDQNQFPFIQKRLPNPTIDRWMHLHLPLVHGVTVNQITTDGATIERFDRELGVEVESMEGAALHYAAGMLRIPFVQLRSISNKVGERDKTKWKIQDAVNRLNDTLIQLVKSL